MSSIKGHAKTCKLFSDTQFAVHAETTSLTMYFPKLALAASFVTLAVATPTPAASCSTGSVQCCDSVQPASSNAVSTLLGLLGIVLQDLTVAVGLTCSPITVSYIPINEVSYMS